MKEELAILRENVYAGRREEKLMSESPLVPENKPPQSEASSGNRLRRPNGERQTGRRRKERGGRAEKTTLKDPFTGKNVEIENPQQLKAFLDQFEKEARGGLARNPFRGLSEEELKNQYYAISRLEARFSQQGGFGEREGLAEKARMFHQVMMQELERRDTDLNELFQTALTQAEEEGTPIRSIGAATIVEEYTDGVLRNIVGEINSEIARVGEGQPLRARFIADQLERVRTRRDAQPASVDEAQRLLQTLNEFAEESERRGEEAMENRQQNREVQRLPLQEGDLGEFDPVRYQDRYIREIAEEVSTRARDTDNSIHADQLTEIIARVNEERGRRGEHPDETFSAFSDQASRLIGEIHRIKRTLDDKDYQNFRQRGGLYAEIRMPPVERENLIKLVISGIPEDDREIDVLFHKLFERVSPRTNDDWNEAFGSGGRIEYDEFIGALENAASGRLTFGLRIDAAARDRLNEKIRQLTAEYNLRQYLHNISYYVNAQFGTEEVRRAVKTFKAHQFDMAFRKPGVTTVEHFFEQAMYEVMAKNGGYLPSKAMENELDESGRPVYGEVEKLVREHIKDAIDMRVLPQMETWEVERAISLARGMGIVSARFFEIAAMGGLPEGAPLVSWWANDIIKKIAFFKQIARYDVGREANRMLAFRLEGGAPVWSIKELTEVGAKTGSIADEVIFGMSSSKDGGERYIEMINPFRVGSVFTQTRWRYPGYPEEPNIHAGAIAALLDGNPFNPLVGVGMWIEKERWNMTSKKPLSLEQQELVRRELGVDVRTEGERAEAIIKKNLELAAKISPLKLLNNLPWLRLAILKSHYGVYDDNEVQKRFISDRQFQEDISKLILLQEKLMSQRSENYRPYLKYIKDKVRDSTAVAPRRPDLYREFTDLDFTSIEDIGQRERVRVLAEHIQREFTTPQHFSRLVNQLRSKGWKVPFVFGTDDLPYDLYDLTETGGTSLDRRWGDLESAAKATDAYEKLIQQLAKARDQETIIRMLDEIYQTLRSHDEGVTREVMFRTVEGITKFFKKDWRARLPLGIGMFVGAVGGKASYAEASLGRLQMAWDETQSYAFIHKVRAANLITDEQVNQLEKLTGSRSLQVGYDMGRSLSVILLAALAFYMATRVLKEER